MAGCDSDDDSDSEADVFLGTWALASIEDNSGDQTQAVLAVLDRLTFSFENDGTFEVIVDYNEVAEAAGRTDAVFAGTYVVNETTNTITLNITGSLSPPFTYNVVSEDEVVLSTDAQVVNLLLNPATPYTGVVSITVERT